jgi:hypothetical protein
MSKDQLANECNTTMEQHNIIARSKGNMAIHWRGEIARDDISHNETPSDEEFC